MTIKTTADGIAGLEGKALLSQEYISAGRGRKLAFTGKPKPLRALVNRIEAAYARSRTLCESQTLDQLQRLVLHTGERMIRIAPHHGVFEAALNEISHAYASRVTVDSSSRVTGLAVFLIDCDTLDYTRLSRIERRACHALVARHYAGDVPRKAIPESAKKSAWQLLRRPQSVG